MLRRRQINADPRGRLARLPASIADVVRWPFERLLWTLERRLLWPLRERVAGSGPPGRAAGGGVLGVVAAAAVLVGVLSLTGGEPQAERAASPAPVAITLPDADPAPEQRGRVLQGAPPSFGVGEGEGVGVTDAGAAQAEASGVASSGPDGEAAEALPEDESAAVISSAGKKPVPAGPAAMKVARRFSEAFLSYEVGERRARAKTVFEETATPELAAALAERPPRLPQGGEVPKARLVNLVPGPRAGRAYTVSVSLLRVGLTTELRLELRRNRAAWLVTDVRG